MAPKEPTIATDWGGDHGAFNLSGGFIKLSRVVALPSRNSYLIWDASGATV